MPLPVALTLKFALPPTVVLAAAGCAVIWGAVPAGLTVKAAAADAAAASRHRSTAASLALSSSRACSQVVFVIVFRGRRVCFWYKLSLRGSKGRQSLGSDRARASALALLSPRTLTGARIRFLRTFRCGNSV